MVRNASKVDYTNNFDKQLKRAPLFIQRAFQKRYELFISNPFHPILHNHQLTGSYVGCRSINITGDWRAVFREKIKSDGETWIYFISLGTHSQLYR